MWLACLLVGVVAAVALLPRPLLAGRANDDSQPAAETAATGPAREATGAPTKPALPVAAPASAPLATAMASAPAATPIRLRLPEILRYATEGNPGVDAARANLRAAKAQLDEALWAWFPRMELSTLLAPAPNGRCEAPDGLEKPTGMSDQDFRQRNCIRTPDASYLDIAGVFVRLDVVMGMPLYTFGKIDAAQEAARAGVRASEQQLVAMRADLSHRVRSAYYGLKLARELLSTIREGKGHLDEALDKVEKDVESGEGDATESDLLRLRAFAAEVEARILEAERGERMALAALHTLAGPQAPRSFDVDIDPLEPIVTEHKPTPDLVRIAAAHRPEWLMLDAAVAARRAGHKLSRAELLPNFLLVGTFSYRYASSVDEPQNLFADNPFHGISGGLGATLQLGLDYPMKVARLARARAQLAEIEAQRRQARDGMALEIERAHAELVETRARVDVTAKGERAARSWLMATVQGLMAGLQEPKDLSDALLAYFTLRLRYLLAIHDHNIAAASLTRATGHEVSRE